MARRQSLIENASTGFLWLAACFVVAGEILAPNWQALLLTAATITGALLVFG